MPLSSGIGAERAKWVPALLGSCVSFLGAAAAGWVAVPEHPVAGALVGLIPGAGAALLNEFHKAYHDSSDEQKARRNHLIRRGMAKALRDALITAETRFGEEVPEDLHPSLFKHWPDVLKNAEEDEELLDVLFPMEDSEDQWHLLNRYYDDLKDVKVNLAPSEQLERLQIREEKDHEALASLLRRLPLEDFGDSFHLLSQTLSDRWSRDASLTFAAKLLPLYRVSFATVFSQGGPVSLAIEYKSGKFTRQQLEDIQRQMQAGFDSLGRKIEEVSNQVSVMSGDLVKLTRMVASLMERQTASGEIPPGVITPENKQARIEEVVRELPKVVEELRESQSPVATPNVEELLAEGRLDEAARVGQVQFNAAQKAYAEQGRSFARAAYDMGRINELSFRWMAAVENYRQAWVLSGEEHVRYGFKYADFAASLNLYQEAIATYEAVVHVCGSTIDFAAALSNLGNLYTKTQRYEEAEYAYSKALEVYSWLYNINPAVYEPHAAATLNNLGSLYTDWERHKDAEEIYSAVLPSYRRLAAADPAAYEPNMAGALNNLGNLYRRTGRYEEAETAYSESLAIQRRLAAADPPAFEPDVARVLYNFGNLFSDTKRPDKAEEAYSESLAIYRRLAAHNPAAFEPNVAITLNDLGALYSDTRRNDETKEAYSESLAIYRKLAITDPEAFEREVANTLIKLGSLYKDAQDLKGAIEAFSEAAGIYRGLAVANPAAFERFAAMTLNSLGDMYKSTQHYEEAEKAYLEALTMYRRLALNDSAASELYVVALDNLGALYRNMKRYSEAEGTYSEALAVYRRLAVTNPATFELRVAMTLNDLGILYLEQDEYEQVEKYALEAEQVLTPLWQANPAFLGDFMARVLLLRGMALRYGGDFSGARECGHRAIDFVHKPTVRDAIRQFLEELPTGDSEEQS